MSSFAKSVWPVQPTSYREFVAMAESLVQEAPQRSAVPLMMPSKPAPAVLPDFPPAIPVRQVRFSNWSQGIQVTNIWKASAANANDVVTLANWAKNHQFRIRAVGRSHNWSPLAVGGPQDAANVLLVDISALHGLVYFDQVRSTATFEIGTTIEEATLILQGIPNKGASNAPGYSWQNFTAPGSLTLGGALAIGAHGTGVPCANHAMPFSGSLSNLVVSFKAVVTDPDNRSDRYTIKEFRRSDPDSAAFLVHLGRAFLTEVTMRVVPNYYLEVQNWYPSADVLFQAASPQPEDQSVSSILDSFGRVEVIWFPFTETPWVKTWNVINTLTKKPVPGPYNYSWANEIDLSLSNAIRDTLHAVPLLTPAFGKMDLSIAQSNAPSGSASSMQGTSRDMLLYVKDNTLRVTAIGYAVQLRRDQVQEAASKFYLFYKQLLEQYSRKGWPGEYPINGPVEMRWTGVDSVDDLKIPGARPPALSAASSIAPEDKSLDTVFWLDVLTLPGTAYSNEFCADLENWMMSQWGESVKYVRPEWSKGWAYSEIGAWTNNDILLKTIPADYNQPAGQNNFAWAKTTLARYDRFHIYTNSFLDVLLPG